MSTIIYDSPIFGPIHSRRLGLSLGINLMPGDGKVCTFDCIYCECGFNAEHRPKSKRPTSIEVHDKLIEVLTQMKRKGQSPDVLTFAGNGEPTAHPDFKEIVIDTLALRDQYCPDAKVSVLTNGTLVDRKNVFDALMSVDNNILKLDTAAPEYIGVVNRPIIWYNVGAQVKLFKRFNGHCIIQTMFMKGTYEGEDVSNLSNKYVAPWLRAIKRINPSEVMIYTIDRETPDKDLQKASPQELDEIVARVEKLGIHATASY